MSEVGFLESEMAEVFARFQRLGKVYTEAAPRVAAIGGSYLASAAEAAAPKGRSCVKNEENITIIQPIKNDIESAVKNLSLEELMKELASKRSETGKCIFTRSKKSKIRAYTQP